MFFGKRRVKSFREGGEFFCPQCYQQRSFRFQLLYEYATLMMVRMFRVGPPEKSVVCSTCQAVFSDAVLDYQPDAADREFAAEVFRINVLMAMVEGQLEPVEITTIQRLAKELTGVEPSRDEIESEVRQACDDQLDAAEMVRRIGRSLGAEGAKIVVQHAYQVASATGRVSRQRQAQLEQFPAGLGISLAGFQQLIEQIGCADDPPPPKSDGTERNG